MFLSKKKWREARIEDAERNLSNDQDLLDKINKLDDGAGALIDIILQHLEGQEVNIFIDEGSDIVSSVSRPALEVGYEDRSIYVIRINCTTDERLIKTLLNNNNIMDIRGKSNNLQRIVAVEKLMDNCLMIFAKII